MVKVERSLPAPASLAMEKEKTNGSYNGSDVVKRLMEDFNNKCYICEIDNLQDPQVEHLKPHFGGKYIDRKFDWNNLFWSCGHCNGVKNQRKYDEHIIDCCHSDPEKYHARHRCEGQRPCRRRTVYRGSAGRSVSRCDACGSKKPGHAGPGYERHLHGACRPCHVRHAGAEGLF